MSEILWTSDEVVAATDGTGHGQWQASGVAIDSRTIQKGDLYVAIVGDKHDGHSFAAAALQAGAAAVLISKETPLPPNAPSIKVPDTLAALEQLALAARRRSAATCYGITGSVGKTTTREMLRHILAAKGPTYASAANLNNHIGTPLSLARLPKSARYAVFELAMNHSNEITPLARMVTPHLALITTIGVAHIANFKDGRQGIAQAKAEIFDGLDEEGLVILPRDDDYYEFLHKAAKARGIRKIFSFGKHPEANARLLDLSPDALEADILGTKLSFHPPAAGEHMAQNALAALLAAHVTGAELAFSADALESFTPLKGRGQQRRLQIAGGVITIIDDCYNANPQSMLAAIKVLAEADGGRRIAVIGDMLELGDIAEKAHADLAPALLEGGTDLVFCAGPLAKKLYDALPAEKRGAWAETAGDLAPKVAATLIPGDTILVKGSRGKQVLINGAMSPSMFVIIAAIESAIKERQAHAV